MCIVTFRFEGKPPSEDRLLERLRLELGSQAERQFDSIEVKDGLVHFLSMSALPLLYAAKVCQELGGAATDPRGRVRARIPIPRWAHTPWTQHPWFKRLSIRLGGISLRQEP
jgi:hypothetical protein